MELTPTQVASASFRTVRKGYDPDEVDAFLEKAARALEEAQQQATAMEARARAAVAKLHEVTAAAEAAAAAAPSPATAVAPVDQSPAVESTTWAHADEAETISRTLLLAQRTADRTIAEANAEAERIIGDARTESEATLDSTREMSARLLEDARAEARRTTERERLTAEAEVQSLVARREFLVGDVDQLEQFLIDQRQRLRAAARQIEALCERVPSGLGHVHPPALSAADSSDTGSSDAGSSDAGSSDTGSSDTGSSADDADAVTLVSTPDPDDTGEHPAPGDAGIAPDDDEEGELLIFPDDTGSGALDPTMPVDITDLR
jgi:cell division initiation protein